MSELNGGVEGRKCRNDGGEDEQARQRDRRESRRVPLAVNASVAEIYSYLIGQDKTDQIFTSKRDKEIPVLYEYVTKTNPNFHPLPRPYFRSYP